MLSSPAPTSGKEREEEAWRSRSIRSHLDLFLGGFRAVGLLAGHDAVEVLRFAQQDLDLKQMQEQMFNSERSQLIILRLKLKWFLKNVVMKNQLAKVISHLGFTDKSTLRLVFGANG
jgi:hypothetical protein